METHPLLVDISFHLVYSPADSGSVKLLDLISDTIRDFAYGSPVTEFMISLYFLLIKQSTPSRIAGGHMLTLDVRNKAMVNLPGKMLTAGRFVHRNNANVRLGRSTGTVSVSITLTKLSSEVNLPLGRLLKLPERDLEVDSVLARYDMKYRKHQIEIRKSASK